MAMLDRPRIEYRTPEDLVREVQRGLVRIPSFQRAFRWEATDILKLFGSILNGYPIGNLLFWRRPAEARQLSVGPLTIDAPGVDSALWVVDGQQRITSLVGALVAAEEASDSRFRVHLVLDTGEFHTAGARQQTPVTWVPVSLLLDTAKLLRWMRENPWLTEEQIALAQQAAKAIREYQIPTYVVTSPDEAPLLEIFTRMNSTGKPLTKSEVFRALHTSLPGDELPDLASIGRVTADYGFGSLDERLVLRCVLAFRGGDIFRDDFHGEFESAADRDATFREVAELLREVVVFLQRGAGIAHERLLPYSHVVPVLVRFSRLHGQMAPRTTTLLRRWIWRSAVAGVRGRIVSADVRNQVNALEGADPLTAAQRLLGLTHQVRDLEVELDKVHFNHAATKLNALGLLSANPVDLTTGEPVDVAALLSSGGLLRSIVDTKEAAGAGTFANRVVASSGGRLLREALVSASTEVAASHLLDEEAQALLGHGDVDAFLAHRAPMVAATIKAHIARMAEWGARDGQAVSNVLRSAA